jgi:hypothetical protein
VLLVFLLQAFLSIDELPAELEPFVAEDATAITFQRGDLNRDGRPDYVLVTETDEGDSPRLLQVIVRNADGSLEVAARSEKAVYCQRCGGMMGDPFMGIVVKPGKFTIQHYGGSAWRWSRDITFAWSRRDRQWQLVRVEDVSFHASDPDKQERTVETPPKHFGKIDLASFDPQDYLGKGPK